MFVPNPPFEAFFVFVLPAFSEAEFSFCMIFNFK
jgi:hypothetical protein